MVSVLKIQVLNPRHEMSFACFSLCSQFCHPTPVHVPPLLWTLPWPTQAFLFPHSTTLIPCLSTAFILLWAMVCSVGAYLHHQIVSFLKTVSSIALDNLLGTKYMSVQVCWKEAKNIPLENKPLGEASHTRGNFYKGLIIWKDVESDIITAAAKTYTKTCWTHIRICI